MYEVYVQLAGISLRIFAGRGETASAFFLIRSERLATLGLVAGRLIAID